MLQVLHVIIAAITTVALGPVPASAAAGLKDASGFVQGLAHPVFGVDHAVAMIGIGMIGAMFTGLERWWPLFGLLIGMAAGAAWGGYAFDLPSFETGVALSSIIIGGLLITRTRLPVLAAAIGAAVLAFPHGYAHGTEMPLAGSVAGYVVGFLIAAAALAAIGVAISLGIARMQEAQATIAQRALGTLIAAVGLAYLIGIA